MLPPLELESRDPFGLISRRTSRDAPQRLFVLPQSVATAPLDIRVRRTRVYPGLIPARKGGPGVEFYGLREYQSGDDWRWLNHRVNARQETQLFVNEFELERGYRFGIATGCEGQYQPFREKPELVRIQHSGYRNLGGSPAFLRKSRRAFHYWRARQLDFFRVQARSSLRKFCGPWLVRQSRKVISLAGWIICPFGFFPSRCLLIMISPLSTDDLASLLALRAKGYQPHCHFTRSDCI